MGGIVTAGGGSASGDGGRVGRAWGRGRPRGERAMEGGAGGTAAAAAVIVVVAVVVVAAAAGGKGEGAGRAGGEMKDKEG